MVLTFVVPNTVFGDCKITDTYGKFEVVCSGEESSGNPTPSAAKTKKVKSRKAGSESQSVIVMNEEEMRIMKTNNQLDGYRNKRKAREKTSEKNGDGHLSPNT